MKFNKFVHLVAGVGVILVAFGYYLAGVIVLVVISLLYCFAFYLMRDILPLFWKFPTVWQDIPETLEVAQSTYFAKRESNTVSIWGLYRQFSIYGSLFEMKIDQSVVHNFERLHPDVCLGKDIELPPLVRAMTYFGIAYDLKPEYLPDIHKAVLVRKRVGGKEKKVPPEPTTVLNPVYN